MALVVFIIIFLCLAVSYRCTKNIFAPAVFTNLIWFVCFAAFFIIPKNLPPLTIRFLGCITIWILSFTFFSLLMSKVRVKKDNSPIEASKLIRDLYLVISVCSSPILLKFLFDVISHGPYDNFFISLRLAAVGYLPPYFTETFGSSYGGIYSIIWSVSYILEIAYFDKRHKFRFFLILLIVLAYGAITVSKAVFVDFFILSLVLLYVRGKVKLKVLSYVGVILLFLIFTLQSLRHGADFSNIEERYEFITLYLNSSMYAFDVVEPMSSNHLGENVFRIFYHVVNKIGLSSIEPIDPLLPFIQTPIITNTYTIMYPFYKDFGVIAVFIFACLYGMLYGYLYKRYEFDKNNIWYLVSYVFMFKFLFYQYAAESILTNLYPFMITLILLYLPFAFSKYIKTNTQ